LAKRAQNGYRVQTLKIRNLH